MKAICELERGGERQENPFLIKWVMKPNTIVRVEKWSIIVCVDFDFRILQL